VSFSSIAGTISEALDPSSPPSNIPDSTSIDNWAASNRPAPRQISDQLWYRDDTITGGNWNKLFPYQLIVVEQTGPNSYSPRREDNGRGQWFKYTLPMPPESFSISMPFAIGGSVTLGGYVEEHNGAPTRNITLRVRSACSLVEVRNPFRPSRPSSTPSSRARLRLYSVRLGRSSS
jgi:hypothetical protein